MNPELTESSIIEKIKDIVHQTFGLDLSGKPDSTVISELGLDSMAILDVIMSLEDELGTSLKNIQLPKQPTLHDVARMVLQNFTDADHA